ncbi:uncharacterized protein LOC115415807 isoform X2 [Sphaeramia orbicularis]|nr:uncharacterized protein LOC115415807 isoform X2 [Sphaeramia orbicularis]
MRVSVWFLVQSSVSCTMAHSSAPPAYQEKLVIVLLGEDTQLKSLIPRLLCGSADSVATENSLAVTDGGAFKVISMPDFSGVHPGPSVTDCMALSQPGPHLFILAVDSHRVHPKKAEDDVDALRKHFGDDVIKHLVVMVKDMDSYQALSPLEDRLGFRLATASENMQRQCKEWSTGPAYNYQQSMKLLLSQRRKVLETQMRDQPHPAAQRPSTDGEVAGGPASSQTADGPEQSAPECTTDVKPAGQSDNVFSMVLVGQTASGKSASANTILSTLSYYKLYKHRFKSELKSVPVTTRCEAVTLKAFGVKIRIVDTPDFFHDQVENGEAELEACRRYCHPERCVVLLVMRAGRFTDGERTLLEELEEKMGWRVRDKTVILLTHGDDLPADCDQDQYVNGQKELRDLVFKCSDRCVVFKNTSKNPQQVMELITKIPDYKKIFPKLTNAISKSPLLFMMATPF